MPGRIESYLHSDNSSSNKGGSLVFIETQTDFSAKTEEFIAFAKEVAKMVYASDKLTWKDVIEVFPHIEEKRLALEKEIKEKITVHDATIKKVCERREE
mgnify:CR=1 FL=1